MVFLQQHKKRGLWIGANGVELVHFYCLTGHPIICSHWNGTEDLKGTDFDRKTTHLWIQICRGCPKAPFFLPQKFENNDRYAPRKKCEAFPLEKSSMWHHNATIRWKTCHYIGFNTNERDVTLKVFVSTYKSEPFGDLQHSIW